MKRTKWSRASYVLSGALILAGCGDLTAGGLGEVEVFGTADDPGAPPPSAAMQGAPTVSSSDALAAASIFEGLLAAEMQVYLLNDVSGQWVEITEGVRDLTLDLRGLIERRVAVRFLDAGRYTRLRVLFHSVEASVLGGLIIGGVPLTGQITVDLGALGTLPVEREVVVEIEREESVDLVLDMNVDVWLPTVSVITRTVAGSALRDALAVRVR
jgi:hypothetical protein